MKNAPVEFAPRKPREENNARLVGIGYLGEMAYICAVKSKWAWFLSKLNY
jgi:hypothetical protein